MNLDLMKRDARPTGGVWSLRGLLESTQSRGLDVTEPVLVTGVEENLSIVLTHPLPYGSVLVLKGSPSSAPSQAAADAQSWLLSQVDWLPWTPPGIDAGETCWLRGKSGGYDTHLPYLRKAVEETTGPVLELGCGEGSTPMLHELVAQRGRDLVSVDNNEEWIAKFVYLTLSSGQIVGDRTAPPAVAGGSHIFFHDPDPAREVRGPWSVAFVDHAPGHTRVNAVERLRNVADYIVVHDTEESGYGVWDTLQSFKHKKHFRRSRPWTSVVSETREIFADPFGVE